jgi:hypothetical protein
MVKKADGSWRPCQDFHRLNLVTKLNIYPLPNMLDLAAKAAQSSQRLTCGRGITRSMSTQSAETLFGLFECKRMPFGLTQTQANPSSSMWTEPSEAAMQLLPEWMI